MENKLLSRYPLSNPYRSWKQDRFILSTFSPGETSGKPAYDPNCAAKMRNAVKTCADAGFNLLESGWVNKEQIEAALPMCERLGIDMIYQNMDLYGGMQHHHMDRHITVDDVRKVVDLPRPYRHVVGFYI
ncbi:MAG: hypothetical protein IJY47_00400 [Clostridia bacterium]|nr:hypothetical protein [Clostridia bacterium]